MAPSRHTPRDIASRLPALLALLAGALAAQQDLRQWPADPYATLAQLPVERPVDGGHVVTVCTRDGLPVSGCDLYVVTPKGIDAATREFVRSHYGTREFDVLASRFGRRYRTAANGAVAVNMPENGFCIAIDGLAIGRSPARTSATRIELTRHRLVRIEVTDDAGRAVPDVPLCVFAGAEGRTEPRGIGRTGPNGRARIVTELRSRADLFRMRVVAGVVARSSIGIDLTPRYFRGAPGVVRLTLPAIGSAVVRVPDEGRGLGPRSTLAFPAAEDRAPAMRWPPTTITPLAQHYANVLAGIDEPLRAETTFDGAAGDPLALLGRGPRRAGETVTLDFRDLGTAVFLRARIATADGDPFGAKQAWIRVAEDGRSDDDRASTDASGQLHCVIDMARRGGTDVDLQVTADARRSDAPARSAVATVPADARGLVDVELELAPEAPIFSGVAVDQDGRPVRGLAIGLSPTANDRDPIARGQSVETDAAGRFAFYGVDRLAHRYTLGVPDGWLVLDPCTVEPGDRALELRVARPGRVVVRLRQPARDRTMSCVLRSIDRDDRHEAVTSGQRELVFSDVPPGRYDVAVRFLDQELIAIDAVDVGPGADCRDPRLVNIDWHARVRFVRVHVQTTDGSIGPPALISLMSKGDTESGGRLPCDERGLVDVPVVDGVELIAMCPGYRSEVVRPAGRAATVMLRPRAQLRLRLPPGGVLPPGVFVRTLALDGARETWVRPEQGEWIVRPDGDGAIELGMDTCNWITGWETRAKQVVVLPESDAPLDVELEVQRLPKRVRAIGQGLRRR